ncbi:MAG: hypothetical protein TIS_03557 [Tissierella sp.]
MILEIKEYAIDYNKIRKKIYNLTFGQALSYLHRS